MRELEMMNCVCLLRIDDLWKRNRFSGIWEKLEQGIPAVCEPLVQDGLEILKFDVGLTGILGLK